MLPRRGLGRREPLWSTGGTSILGHVVGSACNSRIIAERLLGDLRWDFHACRRGDSRLNLTGLVRGNIIERLVR